MRDARPNKILEKRNRIKDWTHNNQNLPRNFRTVRRGD